MEQSEEQSGCIRLRQFIVKVPMAVFGLVSKAAACVWDDLKLCWEEVGPRQRFFPGRSSNNARVVPNIQLV